MDATIVEREGFWALGVEIQADPTQADYADLWGNRFMPRLAEIQAVARDRRYVAVYSDGDSPGVDRILAGMMVPAGTAVPDGLVLREVPAGQEAVFSATLATIGPTWMAAFSQWLPTSGMVPAPATPSYELYPADMSGEPDSPLTIHLSVAPRP